MPPSTTGETAATILLAVAISRVLVLSGSTLNVMFNLFRVVGPPVWIPIKWNIGFLALNALMIVLLMRERGEAEELGKDPEQVNFGHQERSTSQLVSCIQPRLFAGRH